MFKNFTLIRGENITHVFVLRRRHGSYVYEILISGFFSDGME
jgi:hypothetical protein